jgi:hypothetical protein
MSVPVALANEQVQDKYFSAAWGPGMTGKNCLTPDGTPLDCLQYRSIAIQLSPTSNTGTVYFECSNDGVTWGAVILSDVTGTITGYSSYTFTANAPRFWYGPIYFNLN